MLDSFKTALLSLWSNKVRSILNIVGVVIGVSSVAILVALGQGLKTEVADLIQGFGTNVIAITGGKIDTSGSSQSANPANFIAGDILSLTDIESIEAMPEIVAVSPINLVSGTVQYQDKVSSPALYGAYPSFLDALEILKLDKGQLFPKDSSENVIVLGVTATKQLFGDINPVGETVMIGKEIFTVIGTLAPAKTSSFATAEFDAISIVPFDTATTLSKGQAKVFRIYAKANEAANVATIKEDIKKSLIANHDGVEDFSILTQEDMLGLFNTFLDLATTMVTAIAAISLVVGGIGIMNIMLVTVTERTREIGLRKAVGATKGAILLQFLIEAIVVTFVGALIGLLIAFLVSIIVAAKTELSPALTLSIIFIAVGVSVGIGIIFGLWPAVRAAQKDPIEALRYE